MNYIARFSQVTLLWVILLAARPSFSQQEDGNVPPAASSPQAPAGSGPIKTPPIRSFASPGGVVAPSVSNLTCDHPALVQKRREILSPQTGRDNKLRFCNELTACAVEKPAQCSELQGEEPNNRQECNQLRRDLREAQKKKTEICKSNAVRTRSVVIRDEYGDPIEDEDGQPITQSECLARVEECNNIDSSEASVDFMSQLMTGMGGVQMPTSQYANQCKALSQEERRELRSKEDRLKDRIEKLEKELTEVQVESEKQKREIEKSIRELNRTAREEDLHMKNAERESIAEVQRKQIEAHQSIRNLQRTIIQKQNQTTLVMATRAKELASLTNAILQQNCEQKVAMAIQESRSGTNGQSRVLRTRSANSLIASNSRANRAALDQIRQCILLGQKKREETRSGYQLKLDDLKVEIDDAGKQVSEIEAALKLVDTQKAEIQAEQQQNKTQVLKERMSEMNSLQQELQANTQATQQKTMQNQKTIQRLGQELAKASNQLASADQRPDGKYDISEALAYDQEARQITATMKALACPGFDQDSSSSSSGGGSSSSEGVR